MVATWKEALDVVLDIIKDDWNRANTDNIKPVVVDIADEGPERGKRLDLQRSDYILCYETAHNDGANFDRLLYKTRTDLSDRTKKLFRHTFQIEVITLGESIP